MSSSSCFSTAHPTAHQFPIDEDTATAITHNEVSNPSTPSPSLPHPSNRSPEPNTPLPQRSPHYPPPRLRNMEPQPQPFQHLLRRLRRPPSRLQTHRLRRNLRKREGSRSWHQAWIGSCGDQQRGRVDNVEVVE